MDEITVGPLQLCNIPDAQPGIGLGIKKMRLPYCTDLYGTMKSLSWALENLYTRDAQLHTVSTNIILFEKKVPYIF
jgi:hypothetical protein